MAFFGFFWLFGGPGGRRDPWGPLGVQEGSQIDRDGLERPPPKIIKTIGYVKGSSARARNAAADVFASLKNIIGGEVEEYSRLLQQTRDQAVERMKQDAIAKGANAIIAFRLQSSTIAQGASEVVAYGTGVVVED